MKTLLLLPVLFAIASCAHHKDVRPGADGIHHVVVRGSEREAAERKALDEANHYCAQSNRQAVIVQEKTDYSGSLSESDRELAKNASTAAMVLGGYGSAVGSAGTVGYIMTNGKDFSSDMKFKCQ